jgi:hypothetical protein
MKQMDALSPIKVELSDIYESSFELNIYMTESRGVQNQDTSVKNEDIEIGIGVAEEITKTMKLSVPSRTISWHNNQEHKTNYTTQGSLKSMNNFSPIREK